jgi:Pao retrotransposon peptidase.
LNFAKKYRGRKPTQISSVPINLTRRQCSSKLGELYDITGIVTPFIATMKMDLHQIVMRKMDWDDVLPDNLRNLWVSHFRMMSEIKDIQYQRVIVPNNAENLDIQTLDFGDASEDISCAAIYVRFKLKNGSYSCQLIFVRSRISEEPTQPREDFTSGLHSF